MAKLHYLMPLQALLISLQVELSNANVFSGGIGTTLIRFRSSSPEYNVLCRNYYVHAITALEVEYTFLQNLESRHSARKLLHLHDSYVGSGRNMSLEITILLENS